MGWLGVTRIRLTWMGLTRIRPSRIVVSWVSGGYLGAENRTTTDHSGDRNNARYPPHGHALAFPRVLSADLYPVATTHRRDLAMRHILTSDSSLA
jgi:hypothetical protein